MSSVTANSRMIYAFSRDGAVPGHQLWSKINKRTRTPTNSIWLAAVLAFILWLPYLYNPNAYAAVISIAVIGLYIAYGIPILLRLRAGDSFERGPWHLGRWSRPIGIIAVVWIVLISILFILPTVFPVTLGNFNYTIVAVAVVAGGTSHLVGGLGEELVQGPAHPGDGGRAGLDRSRVRRRPSAGAGSFGRLIGSQTSSSRVLAAMAPRAREGSSRCPDPGLVLPAVRRRGPAYYAPYLRAVEAAGGEPVTLDPQPNGLASADATAMVHGIDGLLVPGGWDVDPPAYGEAREEETPNVDPPLDLTEIALVRAAVDEGVPGLRHLPRPTGDQRGARRVAASAHRRPRQARSASRPARPLDRRGAGLGAVASVTAGALMVNSLHHQSVKDIAPGLRATAHSADGVVEGLESPDGMVVAVQCHPEELLNQQGWARSLFQPLRLAHWRAQPQWCGRRRPPGGR